MSSVSRELTQTASDCGKNVFEHLQRQAVSHVDMSFQLCNRERNRLLSNPLHCQLLPVAPLIWPRACLMSPEVAFDKITILSDFPPAGKELLVF